MSINTICSRLIRICRNFGASRNGNVAIIFAIAAIPAIGMFGAAVDFIHANSVKAAMQAALDSTALMLSKEAATDTAGQLQTNATKYFTALFNRPEAQNIAITATFTNTGATQVQVTGSATVPTYFMQLMGFRTMTVGDKSTATWGTPKLQVALVLDNTGSMQEYGKIGALKTASHQLLTQLQNAAKNPGDIQVAIIPFTTDVNVGTSNKSAWWIDWSMWSAHDTSPQAPSAATLNSSCWMDFLGGWPCYTPNGSGSLSSFQNQWTGCVIDRVQNYDTTNTTPVSGTTQTYFSADPSPPMGGCPAQMMPMGNNWSAMSTLIDNMVANGETNLTIGLVWGWQALTGGVPLSDPTPAPGTSQVMIFMTDGLNTSDRWYNTFMNTGTEAQIDARTTLVCQNIKTSNIIVYVIQVDTGNESPASTMLQNCASKPSYWYLLTNPGDLSTTFSQIATNITPLYLSQ